MRQWWGSQKPFVAFVLVVLAIAVAMMVAVSFLGEATETQFVCDADNCVEDSRSWPARHGALFAVAVVTCVAAVGAVAIPRRRQ